MRCLSLRWAVAGLMSATLAGCSSGTGPVPGEQATSLNVPAGSQQVWCAGAGPAVVLVNGIGDDATSAQWLEVERALAKDARVCRYDRLGTGESSVPVRGRGADELAAELDAVVEHAAGGEVVEHAAGGDGVIVVAHSFGGYLAMIYADRDPDRVDGVVLVDALDPSVGVVRGTGATTLDDVAMANEQLDLGDVEAAAGAVTKLKGDPPIVVLSRGRDTTESWTRGQEHLASLSGRSSHEVVPGAGHQIPSDAPQVVVAAVERVLDRLQVTRPG